jgi:uncharacterized protein YjiS (DUF1127 family)
MTIFIKSADYSGSERRKNTMASSIRNAYQVFDFQAAQAGANGGLRQVADRLNRAATALVATAYLWSERAAQRRRLAALDDRLLKDIGVNRETAAQEYGKPFWRP